MRHFEYARPVVVFPMYLVPIFPFLFALLFILNSNENCIVCGMRNLWIVRCVACALYRYYYFIVCYIYVLMYNILIEILCYASDIRQYMLYVICITPCTLYIIRKMPTCRYKQTDQKDEAYSAALVKEKKKLKCFTMNVDNIQNPIDE